MMYQYNYATPHTDRGGVGGLQQFTDDGNQYNQRQVADQQNATARRGQDEQLAAAKLPLDYAQQRFNTVWPFYQSALGGMLGRFGNGQYSVGGQSPNGPHISAGPVYDQQRTQQAVNAQRATNDQQAAGQVAQQQRQTAGQGYGAGSPLASLLQATTLGQNAGNNANMEQGLRFNSAQANASQLLQSQTAQSTQWNQAQQQDIERRKTYVGALQGLLSGLGGLL